jgi:uncharacterized protein YeaO (DUF488 family)
VTAIRVRRAYEPPEADDGRRVLVDRLWPRGLRREGAQIDEWAKELAPSNELRRWFGHRPERFDTFRARYEQELDAQADACDALLARAGDGPLTLLYGARDERHNNAVVLADVLRRRQGRGEG